MYHGVLHILSGLPVFSANPFNDNCSKTHQLKNMCHLLARLDDIVMMNYTSIVF